MSAKCAQQRLYTVFVYCTTDAESAQVDGGATFLRWRVSSSIHYVYCTIDAGTTL